MSQIVSDNILATFYLILWIATFIWYQYKNREFDAGSAILIAYIGYAVFSLLSINDQLFSMAFRPLRLFPYLYLYGMMMIALSPSIYNHLHPSKAIADPNTRMLKAAAIFIIIISFLLVPSIVSNFFDGFVKLFTDVGAGYEAYMETAEEVEDSGSSISNLPAIFYNALADVTVFLCFYFMSLKKKNYLLIGLLLFSISVGLMIPIMNGQRGGTIQSLLTVIACYMLFKKYLSRRINHAITIAGISVILAISLPIAAITMSRFGDEAAGVNGYIKWYLGQGSLYFNNYGLNAGGTRHGDRTAIVLKRIIDPSTPKNYVERRDKYHNLELDDNFFSTFVGDFTIDYGPVAAVIIFVIFNIFVLSQIRARDDTLKVHQLLLLFFTVCVSIQGGMTLFSFADLAGNLRIICIFSLYIYLRYHEVLLERYPAAQEVETSKEVKDEETAY